MSVCVLGAAILVLPTTTWASDESVPVAPSLAISAQRVQRTTDYSADARKKLPWFATASVYIPNFSVSGVSSDTGFEGAIGYLFPTDSGDFRVSARGQSFGISGGGTNATVSISLITFEYLFRFQGFSIGPGVNFGSAQVSNDFGTINTSTQTIWSVAAGYDFTPRWFVEGRWQTASEDGYKGYSIGIGYRF